MIAVTMAKEDLSPKLQYKISWMSETGKERIKTMATLKNTEELNKDEKFTFEELQSASGGFFSVGGVTCSLCDTPNCTIAPMNGEWRTLCSNPN